MILPISSFAGPTTLALSLYDANDPTDPTQFVTSIETPGDARAVAVASGIAYIADGPGGLAVANFLPFDTNGSPPTVSIDFDRDHNPKVATVDGPSMCSEDSACSNR